MFVHLLFNIWCFILYYIYSICISSIYATLKIICLVEIVLLFFNNNEMKQLSAILKGFYWSTSTECVILYQWNWKGPQHCYTFFCLEKISFVTKFTSYINKNDRIIVYGQPLVFWLPLWFNQTGICYIKEKANNTYENNE